MKKKDNLTTALFLAFKAMNRLFQSLAQDQGLATAQWGALKALWKQDGLNISDLCEKMMLKNSTMTALVDRMERDGLVTRKRDKADRRAVRVFLTERGLGLKNEIPDFEAIFRKEALRTLSQDEMQTLVNLLNKLSDGLGKAPQKVLPATGSFYKPPQRINT